MLVQTIYQLDPDLLDGVTTSGKTILHCAAETGPRNVIDFVMQRNPTLLHRRDHKNKTALYYACCNGHFDIVNNMLQSKFE